jgi:hypothetical protein
LHPIPWEILREPGAPGIEGSFLAADSATPFSRYLPGEWAPGEPLTRRPLRVLVAISDPENLPGKLHRPDRDAELAALKQETNDKALELIHFPDDPAQPCTLDRLEAALREHRPDVLHFIGHGVYNAADRQAALYMADPANGAIRVLDDEIAGMIARLPAEGGRPQLVFLAACQSATRDSSDANRGLGPRLVAAGVPFVIAMQEVVEVRTARQFAGPFYRELLSHGQADVAANAARSHLVSARLPGAAIPVLFMRRMDTIAQSPTPGTFIRSNIPRNRLPFLGRDALLEEIATALGDPAREKTLVLHGHPGSGKTELARQFARDAYDRYPGGTFIIDASGGGPPPDLAAIGRSHLGLEYPPDLSLWDQCLRTLLALGAAPSLLIYDGVMDVKWLEAWLPPANAPCHALITTTLDCWGPGWDCREAPPLEDAVALEIVREVGGEAVAARLGAELVRQAGGLPIELVPVAASLAYEARRGRLEEATVAMADEATSSFRQPRR